MLKTLAYVTDQEWEVTYYGGVREGGPHKDGSILKTTHIQTNLCALIKDGGS